MRKSLLLRFLEWIKPYMTNNVVGWIWAGNSITALIAWYYTKSTMEALLAVFFFLIAVLMWNRSDYEKGNF